MRQFEQRGGDWVYVVAGVERFRILKCRRAGKSFYDVYTGGEYVDGFSTLTAAKKFAKEAA